MAGTTLHDAAVGGSRNEAYAWCVVVALMVIYIFNFLDRQLLAILQEPIKAELGLSDAQLGLISGLYFSLVYSALAVGLGFLADRTSRRNIVAAGCLVWSAFTALCGLATSFPTLALTRMGVAVGEAAGVPPSQSIIADYFPAHKRARALAVFSLGAPFGMALGAAFGAKAHEIWGWRTAFAAIGMAGVVASLMLVAVVREPPRGSADGPGGREAGEPASFMATLRFFFSNPVMVLTALGAGFGAFVAYATSNWSVSFLVRAKGMNYGQIALYYSLMAALTLSLGTLLAGVLSDRLGKRSAAWYALVPALALTIGLPFHLGYVWAPDWRLSLAFLAVSSSANIFYLAPALAVFQNYAHPSQRAMVGALGLLVHNLIGLAGGSFYIGALSDHFGARLGAAQGLQAALYWLAPVYVVAVCVFLLQARALAAAGTPHVRAK